MTTTIANTDVVEFTRLGWSTSLDWTVPIQNWETFTAVMHTAGEYNDFDGQAIADTFEPLFYDTMRVEFGREGSPVMYISIPFFPHQRYASTTGRGDRYTDVDRQEFAARVIDWAREVRADEISVRQFPGHDEVWNKPGPKPYRIRLWWD